MKAWTLLAALGVALSGCALEAKAPVAPPAPPPPPPVAVAAPRPELQAALPGPWRITKTQWTKTDEEGFGEFLRRIAESGCSMPVACMQSAANFYHDSDPRAFEFHADCAKWAYMLRAYYASKNGLPFSYVDRVAGDASDLRYGKTPNRAMERRDIVDTGNGIDAVAVLRALHDHVSTATFRMDPTVEGPVMQDFYSPKIAPGAIRAGTTIYDVNGHVMIVYDVTSDGRILYMDSHPDETVTRGAYGPQVAEEPAELGGGFKNFRPFQLVGATLRADGSYIGGHVVMVANDAIADFSLEQYRGNVPTSGEAAAQFRYNNVSLDVFGYVRAAMAEPGAALAPVAGPKS